MPSLILSSKSGYKEQEIRLYIRKAHYIVTQTRTWIQDRKEDEVINSIDHYVGNKLCILTFGNY